MKKSKVLALAGVALLSAGLLAACSGGSDSSKEGSTYSYVYATDPETLDYLASGKASTHDLVASAIDGLLENDKYGNLIPSLAEDWTVSKDGLTYTYTLRKGVNWYTSDGEEYAEVKAQDFVAGLKHAADGKSEALILVQNSVKGLDDYVTGKTKDFSEVGVKALDDYTVQYTLNNPEPYWNAKTTSATLFPVNEEFLKAKGDKFGQATDPSSILYNGPYIIKSLVSKSTIEYAKNENYWDKDNVHFDNVKMTYFDGQDVDTLGRGFSDGNFIVARLFPNSSNYSTVAEKFKENIYYTQPQATTFGIGINIDRQNYNHSSKTTDEQKSSTKKAILNKDFRQALSFALDRKAFVAQVNGEEAAELSVRNLFVPSNFVQVGDKSFGDLVEEKIASYGDEWKDVKLADSKDSIYNPEKAKAEFAKAKEALQAEGVQFPIHLDVPVAETDKTGILQIQSLKQSIEKNLGSENVVIDIQQMSQDELLNITYYAATAAAQDWDISTSVGWTPDYPDPSTYLDILKTTEQEYSKTYLGYEGADNAAAKQVGLQEYDKLANEAGAEVLDTMSRYEKYAAAQAWLTDSSLIIPIQGAPGGAPQLSRLKPFSGAYAETGSKAHSTDYYKYRQPNGGVVTKKEYDEAREKWLKEKAESNAKYQEDLAKHVK
ncbi:peptide ABC transporter substrate-binding protein [Streptococcus himalayensis]|uniref:Peptide ABC transporter ATP-binding protein n=1 Tax=Streptococcus himalayensis TaxID=1888195 RepID=A0A917A750_9STRE|nr:peptide ABC transporter substrate-binding protein [Streptococcus himalayensis]GGE31089.1 peptide ABC transporter ATP-binding protein [Streptococcus himalayensis]